MIVKMKFVSITGPKSDIDRVTDIYLSKYEIQLEHAMSELKTVDNLRPFVEINPYKDAFTKACQYVEELSNLDVTPTENLGLDEMFELVRNTHHDFMEFQAKKDELKRQREERRAKLQIIEPFRPLDCDLSQVLHYKYIQFRFGRISTEYHHRMEKYLLDDLGAIFVEGERDDEYVYGVYFVSMADAQKVDSVFKSLHFEKIDLPDEYKGAPGEAYHHIEKEIAGITKQIEDVDTEIQDMLDSKAADLIAAKNRLGELTNNFDVRKLAAHMEDNKEDYYVLCGWMSEDDVEKFLDDIKNDDSIFVVVEDERDNYFGEAPTKLQNPRFFKPFEMFTRMYGLPAADEMDPTIFVALTYTFIFGAMFGDVGQGLVLLLGGGLIYWKKKAPLAGIISCAGIFSTFFGFMFGSFFGFEDILEPVWLRPIEHMSTLPFVGKLNTVFIVAIAFGMGIIIIAMLFHIINAARAHDIGDALFDVNGVAGLVFYAAVVATIVLFMTGHALPAGIVLAVMFGVPLILILFKEPLTKKIKKSSEKMEESKGMFLVQGFFELFETLLSYFSNTLSFVRIGAFAVSHAAMMQVVLQLAHAETGSPNWIVVILGNVFVCGMEGLIVGIQVLRLEYYEMFSRFYKGTGREFKPYNKKQA